MRKEREITKTETIILLIVLITIGGLVLYGKKGPPLSDKHTPPIIKLFTKSK